jgi:hypothetical protein
MNAVVVQDVDKKFGKPAVIPFWKRMLRGKSNGPQANGKETPAAPLLLKQHAPADKPQTMRARQERCHRREGTAIEAVFLELTGKKHVDNDEVPEP